MGRGWQWGARVGSGSNGRDGECSLLESYEMPRLKVKHRVEELGLRQKININERVLYTTTPLQISSSSPQNSYT